MKELNEPVDFGKYQSWKISDWNSVKINDFVITGPINGRNKFEDRVGRLVQIRLSDGDFGSDVVILRMCDDSLTTHANQAFFYIKDELIGDLEKMFKDVYVDNSDIPYTICGEDPQLGFIIPSKKRDIISSLSHKLSSLI